VACGPLKSCYLADAKPFGLGQVLTTERLDAAYVNVS
jgi:hypothetical protein